MRLELRMVDREYWEGMVALQFDYSCKVKIMAKQSFVKIKLVSTADTGYYYVTKKNSKGQTGKLALRKYDPVARKHVEFKESKIK